MLPVIWCEMLAWDAGVPIDETTRYCFQNQRFVRSSDVSFAHRRCSYVATKSIASISHSREEPYCSCSRNKRSMSLRRSNITDRPGQAGSGGRDVSYWLREVRAEGIVLVRRRVAGRLGFEVEARDAAFFHFVTEGHAYVRRSAPRRSSYFRVISFSSPVARRTK